MTITTSFTSSLITLVNSFIDKLLTVDNLSRNTSAAYYNDLHHFTQYILLLEQQNQSSIQQITEEYIASYVAHLTKSNYSTSSIARRISSIKNFFSFLAEEEFIAKNPASAIKPPKFSKSLPKALDQNTMKNLLDYSYDMAIKAAKEFIEFEKLLNKEIIPDKKSPRTKKEKIIKNSCKTKNFVILKKYRKKLQKIFASLRDAALLEILYSSGMRVSEILSLCEEDIPWQNKEKNSITSQMIITGKGNKERLVNLYPRAQTIFMLFLKIRDKIISFENNILFSSNEKRDINKDESKKHYYNGSVGFEEQDFDNAWEKQDILDAKNLKLNKYDSLNRDKYNEKNINKKKNHNNKIFTIYTAKNGIKPMTRQYYYHILRTMSDTVGIPPDQLSPHKIRHSFATHMLEQGADLMIIKNMLGHESINSTEIYTKVRRDRLSDAVRKHHPLGVENEKILTNI